MSTTRKIFPPGFIWGVAAAAPQIEGASRTDGKGESIWDRFARTPGRILNNDTPDTACDHYHRYPQDFALMCELGIKHYRLSIAWPRIFPEGDGAPNPKGLDFYRRLLSSLRENGITPWVTMFHWDLPQSLEDRFGGWRSRRTVDAFARYADTIVTHYRDEVENWITLNEIVAFTRNAYGIGRNAPGLRESDDVVNQTYHHALLCHGHGVRAVRERGRPGSRVGLVDNPRVPIPLTCSEPDLVAAREWFVRDNVRVLDPVFRGHYSDIWRNEVGPTLPHVEPGDFPLISLPSDFLGLNLYWGAFVRAGRDGAPEKLSFPSEYPRAASSWQYLTPQSLYWGPRLASEIYKVPSMFITEHGGGYDDEPVVNGECFDLHRCELLRTYISELHRAIEEGVPVNGYFLWSFMDNFEWCAGYRRRFGIVHVDYATQKRTPKLSARWYAEVMRKNCLP
ncbi:beta-glucosidase [Opitutaceae bacterium TAV5]|nr:beta-glucosidase [Opitutaceae bacterium TAV5]